MPERSPTRTFKNAAYEHLASVGKALSNSTRLEILDVLVQAPRAVEVLAREVGQSTANTSQHLQVLKRAHLVKGERDGLHIMYSLVDDDVAGLFAQLQEVAHRHIAGLDRLTREFFADRDGLDAVDQETLFARLRSEEAILLDVRPGHEYEAGHLPGALSIPLEELEARLAELPNDRMIVAYCHGPYCAFSADAAKRLRDLGFDARRTDLSVVNLSRALELS